MKVAMDASALMMPVEVGVRVFDELDRELPDYEPVAPAAVRRELRNLSAGAGREATAASVALDLADRCETVETEHSHGDDALVALANAGRVDAVATNDAPLRERLLDAGVEVMHLRGRSKLTRTYP
ncbi:PIN domain-containing protein [Halocalculus aciditolerans]|uniref:VapC9 PIN-like domain-containing protein n=1 Tax=Halocalculus aciditolerans TaxID=1383812 RepID=A0A830F803_9EURY|nr:twitching motility protein PilT [Halocalculus aciditolerans]GGL49429.1 hypothetical protein GCM10009039_04540 [Halocalculus aciditolerans]